MRAVSRATCTSGEPVSPSCVLFSSMISLFRSKARGMDSLFPRLGRDPHRCGSRHRHRSSREMTGSGAQLHHLGREALVTGQSSIRGDAKQESATTTCEQFDRHFLWEPREESNLIGATIPPEHPYSQES